MWNDVYYVEEFGAKKEKQIIENHMKYPRLSICKTSDRFK
jgi:hypothetical protein